MKLKLAFIALFLTNFLTANTINIAVAANVSYAIDELKNEFSKISPKTKVQVILGGSGKLTAQLVQGASYQLFMSADMKYPKKLKELGIAITDPVIYTQGALAIFSSKKRDFSKGLKLLLDEDIDKIAIANPKTAPYGKATVEALKNSKLHKKLKKKFVYAESISQTVSYTITATDIGLIAKSALYSPKMSRFKKQVNWIDIDAKLYTPINQGIVILKNAKDDSEVKAFYDFILSDKAKEIFKAYGYITK